MNGKTFLHSFLEATISEWGYSLRVVCACFRFVKRVETAVGNVVGPGKEFTDWVWSDKASSDLPNAWKGFSTAERNQNTSPMPSVQVTFVGLGIEWLTLKQYYNSHDIL